MTFEFFFGMPVRDHVNPQTKAAIELLQVELRAAGVKFYLRDEPRGSLPLAHSLLASAFLQTDATHLFIVHADVAGFTMEDVLRITHCGEDVVGGPIPGRAYEPERIRAAIAAGIPPERAWAHASPMLFAAKQGPEPPRFIKGHLLEVDWMSTGFLCITRMAIEAAGKHARLVGSKWGDIDLVNYVFEEFTSESGQLQSEDVSFCKRWQKAGGTVWADTKTALTHWGSCSFHSEPLERNLRPRAEGAPPLAYMSARVDLVCPPPCEAEARGIFNGMYDLPVRCGSGDRILDLGANVGAFGRWALIHYPGAVVDCFEPQPGPVLEALRANRVGGLMSVHELAVVASDVETVSFYVRDEHPIGSSVRKSGAGDEHEVTVQAIDAAQLPDAAIVKIDIEGNEPAVLRRYFDASARTTRGLAIEWHTEPERAELRELLASLGFRVLTERPSSPDRPGLGLFLAVRS